MLNMQSAGVIPLTGAVLLVGMQPDISHYQTFRVLVTGQIALGMLGFGMLGFGMLGFGMLGFGIANMAQDCLSRILSAFAGVKGNRT